MEKAIQILVFYFICIAYSQASIQSPPLIVKQPPTNELLFQIVQDQGGNNKWLFIECEAEGEPAPKFKWLKSGKPLIYDNRISQQPGKGTLLIMSPREEDIGQYQCFAENKWGESTSNPVSVQKAEFNSIKDQRFITVHAIEGETLKITCRPPDGWPKPSAFWTIGKNGFIYDIYNPRITPDPEGNLWFSNVTREDASKYFNYIYVVVWSFFGLLEKRYIVSLNITARGIKRLNQHEPVQQYVTKENTIGIVGKDVELYCIFGGTPLPDIIWSKDGKPVKLDQRITQGHYGKNLAVENVNFSDEGNYTCEASNGVGDSKSHSVQLTVLAAPVFTIAPEIQNAAVGDTVTFRCEASGVPKPRIQWIHNGKPIDQASPNPKRKVTPNSIIIEKLEKLDTGNYGCNATNSVGYVYKDVYVNVLADLPPEITDRPTDTETVNGKTVKLTCRVFGIPKPEIKWFRNWTELTGGRYTTLPNGDLEIKDVNFWDSGTYTCYVQNQLGHDQASISLSVKEHTRITDGPEDYEIRMGQTHRF